MSKKLITYDEIVKDVVTTFSLFAQMSEEYREQSLVMFHTLGGNIATHPAYNKGGWGQGDFFQRIAEMVNKKQKHVLVKPTWLHYSVQVYEKYPEVSTLLETLQAKGKKPSITAAKLLVSGKLDEAKVEKDIVCKHCPLHCNGTAPAPVSEVC